MTCQRPLLLLACSLLLAACAATPSASCPDGWRLLALGDAQAALSRFDAALSADDEVALLHAGRARALERLERPEQAEPAWRRAVALQAEQASWLIGLGNSLLAQDRAAEAWQAYDAALELAPGSATAHYDRALARAADGDLEGALDDHTRALALRPRFAEAYNSRGVVRARLRDWSGALADFDRALSCDPLLSGAYGNRAAAHYARGQAEQALADLNEGLRINRRDPGLYARRGRVLFDLAQYERAADDLQRAMVLSPEDEGLQRDLKRARAAAAAAASLAAS